MTVRPVLEGGTRFAPGGHAVVFGHGRASLATTAVAVFDAARDSGEALLLVTDDADPRTLDALPERDEWLRTGRLQLLRTDDAYPDRDPDRLLAAFGDVLDDALADGWTGIRVVAENTSLVQGGDDDLADWLAWEHTTSRWQHSRPVVGVCWFDVTSMDVGRVADLASLHAENHGLTTPPPFRLLAAAGAVRLVGDIDAHAVTQLVRLLELVPHDGHLAVDVSEARYVHHTVFAALEFAPAEIASIRLIGSRGVLRRVRDAVGHGSGRVELV